MTHYVKAATGATWVLAVAAAGLLAGVTSSTNWLALVGCATVPALLLMRSIRQPHSSKSIRRYASPGR